MAPASGPNSSKPTTGQPVAGVYNAAGETLLDGQASILQLDVNGSLKVAASVTPSGTQDVNIKDINGNPPALTNPLPVELSDGTNALGVAGNPVITKDQSDVAPGTTAPTVVGVVAGKSNDGTPQYQPIPEGAGGRSVIVEGVAGGTAVPISGAVSFTAPQHTIVDSGTLTAVTAITNQVDTNLKQVGGANTSTAASGVQKVGVVGNAGAAFDAPATGTAPANVLYEGARAATTFPTAATDGQIVAVMADKAGRTVTVANAPRDLVGTAVLSNNSGTSAQSLIASVASTFTDIITFIVTNRSSTATVITLTDGTVSYTFAIAANGGLVTNFSTPLPATSSATAWTVGNSAAVACDYVAVYAKNK